MGGDLNGVADMALIRKAGQRINKEIAELDDKQNQSMRMGRVGRQHDRLPYRAIGPVTKAEYQSRQERYDTQLKELMGVDPARLTTEEKMAKLRACREAQYELLLDAVYKRRGWDSNGVPTPEKLHELGIDLPEVLDVLEKARQ